MKDDTRPVTSEEIVEEDSTSGTSLTRKKALGVGAAVVGGAALGGLASAGGAQAATKATVPDGAVFRTVLTKLATTPSYRSAALQNPAMITHDYPSLTKVQLEALREAAILSGQNIAHINKVRAASVSTTGSINAVGAIVVSGGAGLPPRSTGWSISCTCCCCCCCGEAAVVIRP